MLMLRASFFDVLFGQFCSLNDYEANNKMQETRHTLCFLAFQLL